MLVNTYFVWGPGAKCAAAFDTGAESDGMLKTCDQGKPEHQNDFTDARPPGSRGRLAAAARRNWRSSFYPGARTGPGRGKDGRRKAFSSRKARHRGASDLGTFARWNHFCRQRPLTTNRNLGNSKYTSSIGSGHIFLPAMQCRMISGKYNLPDETIICPGHGPMTAVAEEKLHNPFFAHRVR